MIMIDKSTGQKRFNGKKNYPIVLPYVAGPLVILLYLAIRWGYPLSRMTTNK